MDLKAIRKSAEAETSRNGFSWMSPEHVIAMVDEIETLRRAIYKIQMDENLGKYPDYLDDREKAVIRRAVVSGLS